MWGIPVETIRKFPALYHTPYIDCDMHSLLLSSLYFQNKISSVLSHLQFLQLGVFIWAA